jgi:CDP-6-deoxy-D-xylo-4-hexulose-3-dehydrase
VGLAQLQRLDGFIAHRRRNFRILYEGCNSFADFLVLPKATPNSDPSWFGFPITVRESAPFSREELVAHLNAKGIATRNIFGGNLVRQPYMKGRNFRVVGELTNSDTVMNASFWVGLYPALGDDHLGYFIDVMTKFCHAK